MVNCSKRFPGSTCLLYPYRSLLFPLSPLPFSCSILILLPAVPPECGACLRRKSWQVCFESSAPAPSDLSRDFLSSFLLFRQPLIPCLSCGWSGSTCNCTSGFEEILFNLVANVIPGLLVLLSSFSLCSFMQVLRKILKLCSHYFPQIPSIHTF